MNLETAFPFIYNLLMICLGLVVLYLLVVSILLPHYVFRIREEVRIRLDRQTLLLEKILAEAVLHTNTSVVCPSCGVPIALQDGRGCCASCKQQVKA
ncbi:MAG: hypothetical protein WCL44_09015 [bacterium]